MTIITCSHCGPIRVTDPAVVRSVLISLLLSGTGLEVITCPMCHDEVRSRDVVTA